VSHKKIMLHFMGQEQETICSFYRLCFWPKGFWSWQGPKKRPSIRMQRKKNSRRVHSL